ncbi:MAG: hypothetical protein CFE37_02135 [Alphaproteobacteria bacterium PA4]|nr:MAG: hypothetical protein CFE37_02135 [Alphaproteobacteria bacterium PA4]
MLFDPIIACTAVLLLFAGARAVSARVGHPPWASPVLLATLAVAVGLAVFGIAPARFAAAATPLRWLLGPALVALALVIFDNRALLRAEARPVLIAVIGGTLIGLASAWGLAVALGLPPLLRAALTTKTVTTPFSVAIMTAVGGPVALAAAFSVLTGVIGALLVPALFRWLGIASATGRALGLGVSAHIVGTDWQMRRDARAGGLSALAFVLAGLVAALLVPPLWGWLTAA